MQIRVGLETPNDLLSESLGYNDYQYCLVHLLDEQPLYKKHFERCRDEGEHVLLDNSIFELGKAFDMHRFALKVEEMRPNEFIVPDVLEDAKGTVLNFRRWMSQYGHLPGERIGVVQGKNYKELVWCYKELDALGADKIAFSFDYSFYIKEFASSCRQKMHRFSEGRKWFITQLVLEDVINFKKKHHLLGCSVPSEFKYYVKKKFSFIDSLDTSNPIICGLEGIKYPFRGYKKPKTKFFTIVSNTISKDQKELIKFNVEYFKNNYL